MSCRILYAEDDQTLAFLTQDNLEQNGYEVTHCKNGQEAYDTFISGDFDICVFDIMMPKMDGFELATRIRNVDPHTPIIFLSAKTLKEDRIKGLRLGADDYLVKPFSIEELILKIEIFRKRSQKSQDDHLKIGRFQFDTKNYLLFDGDQKITLTQRESDLLRLFLEHKNTVLRREEILKALWGEDDYFMGRSLDVFISRLRKILVNEPGISIDNIHGVGFRLTI